MSFTQQLEKQKPTGTAWHTFQTLWLGAVDKDGTRIQPRLEVKYAGKGNPGYRSAVLKIANETKTKPMPLKITETRIEESAASEAEIFAAHVVVSWEHVHEDDGKPAPCTPTKALELLLALAQHHLIEFQEFLAFCRERTNFPNALEATGVELGKG